jgi:hypothetical protein
MTQAISAMAAMLTLNLLLLDYCNYCEGMRWNTISALPLPVPLRRQFVARASQKSRAACRILVRTPDAALTFRLK